MAIPQAPCSLEQQVAAGSNIVVTVVLQGLGRDFNPGSVFNSGNPTATFTIPVPRDAPGVIGGAAGEGGNSWQDIVAQIELAWREGSATVAQNAPKNMTRAEYDTKSAELLREFAKTYDPLHGPSHATIAASVAIEEHAAKFQPEWYPKQMGQRITERSRGLLVTVISEDGASTETYSFDRDDRPAHFADLANTLDMVLMKVGAPAPEVGKIKQRVLNEPPAKTGRRTQKAIV